MYFLMWLIQLLSLDIPITQLHFHVKEQKSFVRAGTKDYSAVPP
jgi:hypothetical protein